MKGALIRAVMAYAASCWASQTIEGTMSAMSAWHTDKGVTDETKDVRAKRALAGAKRMTVE